MNELFASIPLFADFSLWGLFWGLFDGELERRGWFPGWLALLLGLAAVGAICLLYALEAGRLGVGRRMMLGGVRMVILLVVAYLLLRPVWVSETTGEKPRPVAVLIDVSQSMDNKDPRTLPDDQWRAALAYNLIEPGKPFPSEPFTSIVTKDAMPERPSRIEVARAALSNPKLDLLNQLKKIGPLEVSVFGSTRTGKNADNTDWIKTLAADQNRTALVNAAFELINRDPNERPAAIVIVTDGRENASDKSLTELASKCRDYRIPIYVYGVGSSWFAQLRLREAGVPESMFLDDLVSIPVRYSVKGVTEGKVDIVVKYGDREVVSKRGIDVKPGDDLRETVTFTPTKEDANAPKQDITVTVTLTTGVGTTEPISDSISKPTQLVNKKLKVLVVDGLPRIDFRFLQRALERDRRVDARFFLTEGDRDSMKSGYPWLTEFTRQVNGTLSLEREEFRKLLNSFDLLILGDVPNSFFSPEQQQVIKEFVGEGGGMIHIAGRWNAPRGWIGNDGQSPIADVLPVELKPIEFPIEAPQGRHFQPFNPVLAPNASRNPLVSLEEDPLENAELWGRLGTGGSEPPRAAKKKPLPPMDWYYPVIKLKPGAESFLIHPTARTPEPDNKPMPLLAGHYFGKGYVLFSGFDDTWRWRFNEGDKYFGRFWSQCVYQAGVPRLVGTKLTQLSLDTPDPLLGRGATVYARVLDENFKPFT
ncbi:MAG: VWA domain-containing protein, partial [Planctomycetia bacterium]|nr:VWA domain-containing protein [Planctomycetia bacterium]